ncbi:hypothetical protein L596_008508 [Steinernema carpocapsae]|nr:hypothetical protein L596_008508 [Steinernema carpocapsae]
MTSWSVRNSQCEYDPKCLKPGEEKVCREGDVIPSVNCETYKRCRHGEFVKKNCDRFAGNGACSHCYSENQDWRDFCPSPDSGFADFKPVHCRHGDRFVNPESCNEYVECLEGVWYTRVCPAGHVYDKQSNGCRRSKSLSCGLGNDSVYMPSKEDDNDDEYKTDDRFVDKRETCDSRSVQKIADIYDCAKYKVCNLRSGFYEDRSCLFGEQFDRRKGECVWGHKCNPEECTEGTRFPRPECGKLQYCKDGMLQNFKCKNGAVFENNFCSKTKFCKDYEGHLYPLTCAEGMTAEHTSDCSKYLICFRNNFVERQCVSGQNFNPELGKCDYKYRCKATNVPTCYHGETRAVPHKCDQFELCQDSRFALQSCPFGTVYNPHRMRCEPGKCEKTKNPSDQRGSEKCKESSLPDGFKPHPTDCGRFYHCAHGRWVPKSCQPGLVFNPALAVCDWPRNVPGCD